MRFLTFFSNAPIRIKILLISMIVQVVLLSLLIVNSIRLVDDAARANLENSISHSANLLSAMAVPFINQSDFTPLQGTLGVFLSGAENDGVVYVRLGDSAGNILLNAGAPEMTTLPPPDVSANNKEIGNLFDQPVVHVRLPLLLSRNEPGFLQFGISNASLSAARKTILTQSTLIAMAAILATFILFSIFGRLLTRRLMRMETAIQALSKGRFDCRIQDEGMGEIVGLARHFNAMSAALQQQFNKLQHTTEHLKANNERYALAIRGVNDGLWDWDIAANRANYSSRFCEILGHPADASVSGDTLLEAPTTFFTICLHPDESIIFRTRMTEHLKGISPQFVLEHRIRHEDGSYRWIMTRGVAQRNEQGRAVRMAGSISDIHLRKCAEHQLQHDAMRDVLTGLPNQPLFIEHLRQALAQRERDPDFRFAVLALDFERFHLINDSYSHATGDHLLRQVADHLGRTLRSGDILARLSADQFAILLHDLSSTDEALETAKSLLDLPAFTVLGSWQALHIRCRIGVAMSDDGNDAETLLRDADNALQSARHNPSTPIQVFQASMHDKVLNRLTLETELRDALAEEKLTVAYQPIIRLFNSNIVSFEALARWQHPQQGFISPNIFIPLAESLDLVHKLGMFVLNRVCLDIKKWISQAGIDNVYPISVNLSARQLSRPNLASELLDTIAGHGLTPELLRFEVTESLFAHSGGPATETLQKLRETKIVVLIDDFGTGYSALNYLHTLPCDILKLDGSFVDAISVDSRLRAIVRHSIGLAHDLGMTVIAEGIESETQSLTLRSIGCDFGQGFLFSKPVPAEDALQLLLAAAKNKT
ncbi:MAG: EAL domain-containing protein [Azoarcus sp.]|jgi:diguanylate cyclase (GGDEF)-like protein/PAS domain S-box-containing protein|nr:EAL domain-containing protein [Azoarcus sp.]